MWIYISTTAKTIVFHAKSRWEYLKIQILQKYPQVIVEKTTENSTNSSSYTIEYKLVRNSHLLSQNWHFFSSVTAIVQQTSIITHTQSYQRSN